MADDLAALRTRLKDLPPGAVIRVLVPQGDPATVGALQLQAHDTFWIAAAFFAPPAEPVRTLTAMEQLNIRADALATSDKIGVIAKGEPVRVADTVRNGYVRLAGRDGWVALAYLTS